MLTVLFFGTGVALLKLRQRAMNANECYDFDENELEAATAASLRSCCSSTNSLCSLDGEAGAGEKVGEATAAPDDAVACKFCHEDSTCRFCFGGPEKDQLIAPCLCVGSQVRPRPGRALPQQPSEERRDRIRPRAFFPFRAFLDSSCC